MNYKKVVCPDCGRTIAHYLSGENSIYKVVCPKCGSKTKHTIIIYSAGKTAIQRSITTKIEFNIKF
ncbi:MAG: hypothetical protein ACFFDF_03810 [Candidatus Odinarchaeota archaeon]